MEEDNHDNCQACPRALISKLLIQFVTHSVPQIRLLSPPFLQTCANFCLGLNV